MVWSSQKIRSTFLEFFSSKVHEKVPSAPMVVKDDPTLMFTNAGMNQFKDYFLGNSEPATKRVTNSQKCLRVSGKHNDLEEVGIDTYHHTMFEMLGNWSFGDYFKQETIDWAWELLTNIYRIDKDRLYVSVFGGDSGDGLERDKEAFDIWKNKVEENRILECSKKDNFWEMGDMGPCGPCSEIHIDLRPDAERKKVDGASLVNQDHPLVVEIWNLVFMQYNRLADGSLEDLPNKHVDTGMGFERLAMALQNKESNYDTDIFQPLIQKISSISNVTYEASDSKKDVAIRVVADHIRAISFAIADGQLPSNTGAGYVIRRILRRAVRYGYSFLNLKEPFLFELVSVLVDQMGIQFPEIVSQQEIVKKVIKEEEQAFLRTLEKGIVRFNEYMSKGSPSKIDGHFAFELYDTFGFPIDLTQLLAHERGVEVNMGEFNSSLEEQKVRSRKATEIKAEDWVVLMEDEVEEFVGYERLTANVKITRYRTINMKGKQLFQMVFNYTPFYPEGGGQVGDTGFLEYGEEKVPIIDTKKENNLIIHFAEQLPHNPKLTFKAVVNEGKRRLTESNHSATHLMHEALRTVLGTHVEQKGSLVNAKHLRFDFSHFQKVTKEEIGKVEDLVNQKIREGHLLEEKNNTPIDEAKAMGAMALFGEKYGEIVRVIKFGSSIELCGGTHVDSTANIGLFKIVAESSVAAGIRRIEAITNASAQDFVNKKLQELDTLHNLLKHPKQIVQSVQDLLDKNAQLEKRLEEQNKANAKNVKADLIKNIQELNGIKFLGQRVELDNGSIKDIAFQLKKEEDNLFMILGNQTENKATITIAISDQLVSDKNLHAGNIIRDLAKEIQGGGGGQPSFATAGGKNPAGIEKALEKAKALLG